MKALLDQHHADLFYGMQLLLEDGLGIEVYTPKGYEWFDQGYWQFGVRHLGRVLADQYLNIDANYRLDESGAFWTTIDPAHPDRVIRCVTRDQFDALGPWDYIVATVQDNQPGFHRLASEVGARSVYQVGNTGQQIDWALDPLVISSSEMPILGRGVVMHQPFDYTGTFGYRPPYASRLITSWVNCMPSIACWPILEWYRAQLAEFTFAIHGIDGPEGNVKPVDLIAKRLGASMFVWHDKQHGDGFGHAIHNAAAIGRPLIGHASHYAGKMAERFWQDGVTAIDLDQRTPEENVALIRAIANDSDRHRAMCEAIRAEFDKIDWRGERRAVGRLLGL